MIDEFIIIHFFADLIFSDDENGNGNVFHSRRMVMPMCNWNVAIEKMSHGMTTDFVFVNIYTHRRQIRTSMIPYLY